MSVFGRIEGATIKNLKIKGGIFGTTPNASAGGIGGRANGSAVTNCSNMAYIS